MPEIYHLEKIAEDRIHEIGWEELTPIQKKAFPVILGRVNAHSEEGISSHINL
ncbi:MAG: hypothetical protein H3Z54_10970 [archaeon]|nr:hypothetical protein [archaeon]